MHNNSFSISNTIKYYKKGKELLNDPHYFEVEQKIRVERSKTPSRTEIINLILSQKQGETCYLEIGVRNPKSNFNHIVADKKYSVDPGLECRSNPVDFKMTSDVFFQKLAKNEVLSNTMKFDVIFIDGLHLAEQVDRDIQHALQYINDDGFIVLHDCNPPSEWHTRERSDYLSTPAERSWNGTTWKAFFKWRCNASVYSCCIDTDWGVGVLSKQQNIGLAIESVNPFFEFTVFDKNRTKHLNLLDFKSFKEKLKKIYTPCEVQATPSSIIETPTR